MMSRENLSVSYCYAYEPTPATQNLPPVTTVYVSVPTTHHGERVILAHPASHDERSRSPFRYDSCYNAVTSALTNNSLLESALAQSPRKRRYH